MENALIRLKDVSLSYRHEWLLQNISMDILLNENIIITGPSGSGKTILGKILANQLLPKEGKATISENAKPVILVNQQQDFRTAFSQRSYYQNRYEYNNDQDTPTVAEYLSIYFADHIPQIKFLLTKFSLQYILERTLTQLSNGEGKRLQLLTALAREPAVLILDNPFTGVDKQNRQLLIEILDTFNEHHITYILLSKADDIPNSISKIIRLTNGRIVSVTDKKNYIKTVEFHDDTAARIDRLLDKIPPPVYNFTTAIQLKNVSIQYEKKVVLDNISWQVNRGERWLLKGANGSGKSMLLSLLNGDNPKAFGKGIILFDKPKGSGESIWELKSKIGYVSPEMHIHFLRKPEHVAELIATQPGNLDNAYQPSITCREVIASGFNEEMGFVTNITSSQNEIVNEWLQFLQIELYGDKAFYQMPASLQRLSLLARALVRNPPLLILDEPCQGLDEEQTTLFKETVEHFCSRFGNTLIYVSHYESDVPGSITNMLELENGKIKFMGTYTPAAQ